MSTNLTIGAERILERRGAIGERERPAPAARPTLPPTPSSNRAIIAAAGARKTQIVVDGALSDPDRRVLVSTYTNGNLERIRRRLGAAHGGVPVNVEVMPWMTLLLREGACPYQSTVFGQPGLIAGVNFEHDTPRFAERGTRRYYLDRGGNVFGDVLSDLACLANENSGGEVIRRLEAIYDHIYIDEIQDLVGWDLEFLDLLFASRIGVTVVGDPRQHILFTNRRLKNKKYRGSEIVEWLGQRTAFCEVETRSESFRCNQPLCDFASGLFPQMEAMQSAENALSGHDGIFEISAEEVDGYVDRYRPVILRHDRRARTLGHAATNIGLAKGSTWNRVLIFPTRPMREYLADRDPTKLRAPERLYVAVTRARYSAAFVV
jgi:DNA helicase-2/ATP-dependent DNA helicase PcrA